MHASNLESELSYLVRSDKKSGSICFWCTLPMQFLFDCFSLYTVQQTQQPVSASQSRKWIISQVHRSNNVGGACIHTLASAKALTSSSGVSLLMAFSSMSALCSSEEPTHKQQKSSKEFRDPTTLRYHPLTMTMNS